MFYWKSLYPQRNQVGAISRQNNKSSYSMVQEGDNENDKYYVSIKTISGWRIVKPNLFGQASEIAIGVLTCQYNSFLQTSRPGSIETKRTELENVSIFKATKDHTDIISRNSDDGSVNLAETTILEAETSQKDDLHLGETMISNDHEDFIKAIE